MQKLVAIRTNLKLLDDHENANTNTTEFKARPHPLLYDFDDGMNNTENETDSEVEAESEDYAHEVDMVEVADKSEEEDNVPLSSLLC